METLTIPDFLKAYKIGLSAPVLRKWISENLESLRASEIILFREGDKRSTYRILNAEKLKEAFLGK